MDEIEKARARVRERETRLFIMLSVPQRIAMGVVEEGKERKEGERGAQSQPRREPHMLLFII